MKSMDNLKELLDDQMSFLKDVKDSKYGAFLSDSIKHIDDIVTQKRRDHIRAVTSALRWVYFNGMMLMDDYNELRCVVVRAAK